MQVDALDVAAAGVLEHAEPQLLTMLSGQLIAASSHKGAQEAERSGSIASAAAAAQVNTSCNSLVADYCTIAATYYHHSSLAIAPGTVWAPFLLLCTLRCHQLDKLLVQRLASSFGRRPWLQVDRATTRSCFCPCLAQHR